MSAEETDFIRECFQFLRTHAFKANALIKVRGVMEETGIEIEYRPENLEMKLMRLKPDLPPYVHFKSDKILISNDGKDYSEVGPEIGFQILRLFDPRILLDPHVSRIINIRTNHDRKEITIEYDLSRISEIFNFPPYFMEEMEKQGRLKMSAICVIQGRKLLEMEFFQQYGGYMKLVFAYL
ncbi:MAG: hypothetical protein QXF52_09895 [Thermoproteota archaeon]